MDILFPVLTAGRIGRIAAHGTVRAVAAGEVLTQSGERSSHFFVVMKGEIEVVRPSVAGEELIALLQPGMFTGEMTMLSGRRGIARIRATQAGEVVDVGRDDLLKLIQADSEISETLLRAFILRRVELIAHGSGDVVLLGSSHCAGTLRIREFLTRNGHPRAP